MSGLPERPSTARGSPAGPPTGMSGDPVVIRSSSRGSPTPVFQQPADMMGGVKHVRRFC
jgi:hypothetical protein